MLTQVHFGLHSGDLTQDFPIFFLELCIFSLEYFSRCIQFVWSANFKCVLYYRSLTNAVNKIQRNLFLFTRHKYKWDEVQAYFIYFISFIH